jgi:hypothetical protein
MTQVPPNTVVVQQRARRAFPLFLVLAFACFLIEVLVAGAVITFLASWAVWLGAAGMSLCLHWWFNVEL